MHELWSFAAHHAAMLIAAVVTCLGVLPFIFGATNQAYEQFSRFELQAPSGVAINSNDVLLFGQATHVMIGVAQTSVPASLTAGTVYDDNTGFVTVQVTGAANLTVSAFRSKSPSAGAAINRGDAIYADGGTFDPVSGITYGNSLDVDTAGTFIGIAMDPLAAGATGSIRVILRNSV